MNSLGQRLTAWRQSLSPELVLHIAGLGVALSLLGDLTLYVVLPTRTNEAGIALADVGLMLSANRLIRIFLNSPYGMLIERIPRRRMAVPALFLGALSSLLYTVPGFWTLLIGRLAWGAAWAGVWLSASTMALDVSTERNRGRLIGRLQMWFFIGSGISSLLGGVLTDWLGYIATFRVCFVITMLAAVFWWLCLPETRTDHEPGASAVAGSDRGTGRADAPQTVWKRPLVTAIALLGVNWLIFIGVFSAILPLLLEERIGESITALGFLIPLATFTGALAAGNQVLSLLASPMAGWLSDRTRQRWGLVIFALVLGTVAMGFTAIGYGVVVVLAALLGAVATSVLQTQVMTLVGDYTLAHQRGRILGVLNTVGDIGSAGGPLLAYALLPVIEISGIFWVSTLVLALMLPWTIWIARQEDRPLPAASLEAQP